MASESHKRMMKRIPKEIQQIVEFNLDIADEIYDTLEQKGLKPADLARLMKKSESEISKWLTGTHNFSIKTIQKIGLALDINLLMTKSAKIAEYEAEKLTLKNENKRLLADCERLRNEREGMKSFGNYILNEKYIFENSFLRFIPNKKDNAKLKAIHTTDYNVQHFILNN